MPFIPVVRVPSIEAGIEESLKAEHQYKHTSIIHSHDVNHGDCDGTSVGYDLVHQEWSLYGRAGPGGRRLLEFFHCDTDRRRSDQSTDLHTRQAVRHGG